MFQSNGDQHTVHGPYTDLSDPPDLFASLQKEQIPPPEDINPSDPNMIPYKQELKFEGDLYTPRWVRGHGNKREGWCGIESAQLKAAPSRNPLTRGGWTAARMSGKGLCGS